MNRRAYLAISGALCTGLAGCTGGSEEIDESEGDVGGSDNTPEETDEPTATEEQTTTEEQTPTEPSGEPDVEFGEQNLIKDDSGYTTEAYAEVVVENTGDGSAGQVNLNVEWYDADGNYLDDTTGRLPSLDAGEVWVAQVSALISDTEDIESIEVSGEFENAPPVAPDGMEVTESELEIGDYSAEITGVAENSREDEIGYVEAHAKIYDDQDRVIGGGYTNETDIPAGINWAFGIRLTGRASARAEDAAYHLAFLDADLF